MKNDIDCNSVEKDMFTSMVEDWLFDVGYGTGTEYDDLKIDLSAVYICEDTGQWCLCADDAHGIPYAITYNTDNNIFLIA